MTEQKIISKVTEFITRGDGSQIRITATNHALPGQPVDPGVFVHRRATDGADWLLCGDRPAANHKSMSRADYMTHGRPEMLNYVSWGEILRATSKLGQPIDRHPECDHS